MKTAFTVLCSLAILTAVGTGTAFADAGVDPVAAENVRTEFDFEQGHFIGFGYLYGGKTGFR